MSMTAEERYAKLCEEAAQALADLNALQPQLPVEWDILDAAVRRAYRANREAKAFYRAVMSRPTGRVN